MVTTSGGRRAKGTTQEIDERTVRHVPSTSAKWELNPAPGVTMAPLRGEVTTGPYACFTKFEVGADHGWHTHTNDVSLVVLRGAYLFKDERGEERRVAAGEYFFIPGGVKHWSGGDRVEGCVFYQEGPAAFDLNPID